MTLRGLIAGLSIAGVVIIGSSLAIHPFGPVKNHDAPRPLFEGTNIDASIQDIVERSCRNCHSPNTRWPVYSYVAPVSWFIERDVSRARAVMDLSRWETYPAQRRMTFMTEIAALVPARLMPPARYVWMHREARLSQAEMEQLSRWAGTERDRLKSLGARSVGALLDPLK